MLESRQITLNDEIAIFVDVILVLKSEELVMFFQITANTRLTWLDNFWRIDSEIQPAESI